MKCLSIKQPWAEFIINGRKNIEVRTWTTLYRGEILIHAGKNIDKNAIKHFNKDPDKLNRGFIIGKATIKDIIEFNPESWSKLQNKHLNIQNYKNGLYGWVLSNPIRFINPIPYKGSLNLFNVYIDNPKGTV